MEALNRWLEEQTRTPAGSILIFLAIFLVRIAVDRWDRRRSNKHPKKKKGASSG